MASLSERLRQKKEESNKQTSEAKPKGLKASNLAIPAVDAGIKSLNRSSIVNEKLLEIDPLQCQPWQYHNRHQGWLDKHKLSGLIESISLDGQLQPGLVRKTKNDQYPYEIIFGVRRWSACKALGRKFRARITQEDDKSCIRLMHFENEESKNISPLEKAFSFAEQLDTGLYQTQAEFAEEMNMTVRNLSRILRIAKLRKQPNLTELLFKFVDDLSLRAVEEVASVTAQLGGRTEDIIAQLNYKIQQGTEVQFNDVLKSFKSAIQNNGSQSKPQTKVYLKQGRKSLVQVTRKKNELLISLKQGIELSEDISSLLMKIAEDCQSGAI